ncbi:MAG: GDSL-type esterase/lipase family protein, partial [Pseudomonadota bacterium]
MRLLTHRYHHTAGRSWSSRSNPAGYLGLLAVAVAMAMMAGSLTARAQDNFGIDSYITPFPKNDIYQIRVMGDSLAAGLQGTISDAFGRDPRINVNRKRWTLKRLTSKGFSRQVRELRGTAYRDNLNVAVVMVGAWDRRNVRDRNGKRLRKGSGDWRAEYGRRVDAVMKTLRAANVAVYWVGLPPFRRGDANEDVQVINDVIRERAYLNGVKYIDAYASFAGEQSAYSPYGPDLSGKIKLLRERDGIHLSYAGNQKLAHFIERAVMRDIDIARKERAIPLDGDLAEQTAIRKR